MKRMLFSLLVLPALISGQDMVDHTVLQKEHPGENAIYLNKKELVTLKVEKGQLKVITDFFDDLLLLNDKGILYNERSVYYSHFEEVKDIKANTLVPNGKSYKKVKVSHFEQKDDVSSGVFYDDQKAISFHFTDLKPGARTQLAYREIQSEPRFFGMHFFGSYVDVAESEFSVRVPEGVEISYKLFNVPSGFVQFTETVKGKEKIYTWKGKNLPRFESEEGSPNIRYYAPHVIIRVLNYRSGKETIPVLTGAGELYNWYYGLVKDVNKSEDPHLKHVVDSLMKDVTDEYTKVKKVYYWVQDNVKYVAFEDGLGGFVPREAGTVCSRRYGDCKDMASIITTMLRMAGVKSYLTWIGSRDIPYSYQEVPSPLSDNHMIATWISPEGHYYFLDATGKNAPLGYHTAMIQGKEALIGIGPEEYRIVTVPTFSRKENFFSDSTRVWIEGLEIKAKGQISTTGYGKIRMGELLQSMNQEDKENYLKRFVERGNNKCKADSVKAFDYTDREKSIRLEFSYTLPDYLKVNGDEIYFNLNIDKTNKDRQMDMDKRKTPYEMDYRWTDRFVTVLDIPAGYEVTYIPPDVVFDNPRFGFTMKYVRKGNQILLYRDFYQEILLMQRDDCMEWNKLAKELNKAFAESIILKKKSK
ncbi:MAG: DUF3857 domain-containing protein [Bacteroidia bacterium]|nr:DUF3857 domain-containing protein [Bacteroidia bacterium]